MHYCILRQCKVLKVIQKGMRKIWGGGPTFSRIADPIATHVPAVSLLSHTHARARVVQKIRKHAQPSFPIPQLKNSQSPKNLETSNLYLSVFPKTKPYNSSFAEQKRCGVVVAVKSIGDGRRSTTSKASLFYLLGFRFTRSTWRITSICTLLSVGIHLFAIPIFSMCKIFFPPRPFLDFRLSASSTSSSF